MTIDIAFNQQEEHKIKPQQEEHKIKLQQEENQPLLVLNKTEVKTLVVRGSLYAALI